MEPYDARLRGDCEGELSGILQLVDHCMISAEQAVWIPCKVVA